MKFRLYGEGPAAVFLHGLPTSGLLWQEVVEVLQKEFTCVVVDLPGLGDSTLPLNGSLDPDHYAKELEMLRKQLSFPSWHIIGHDAGSTIAVHYAAQFKERTKKLVLCSPPIFPEHKVPWFFRLVRLPLIGDFLTPIVIEIFWIIGFQLAVSRRDSSTTAMIKAFRRPFTGYKGWRRFVHILRWGHPAEILAKTAASLPNITASTLILHGKNDGAIPTSFATRAAQIIPNAEVHLLNCGHFLPIDCPDALCGYVMQFLLKPGEG